MKLAANPALEHMLLVIVRALHDRDSNYHRNKREAKVRKGLPKEKLRDAKAR